MPACFLHAWFFFHMYIMRTNGLLFFYKVTSFIEDKIVIPSKLAGLGGRRGSVGLLFAGSCGLSLVSSTSSYSVLEESSLVLLFSSSSSERKEECFWCNWTNCSSISPKWTTHTTQNRVLSITWAFGLVLHLIHDRINVLIVIDFKHRRLSVRQVWI